VTRSPDGIAPQPPLADVPAPLAEYADRLLLSTGLHAEEALLIARGQLDPPAELEPLTRALRAGWNAGVAE
jgi:hypothetical protein